MESASRRCGRRPRLPVPRDRERSRPLLLRRPARCQSRSRRRRKFLACKAASIPVSAAASSHECRSRASPAATRITQRGQAKNHVPCQEHWTRERQQHRQRHGKEEPQEQKLAPPGLPCLIASPQLFTRRQHRCNASRGVDRSEEPSHCCRRGARRMRADREGQAAESSDRARSRLRHKNQERATPRSQFQSTRAAAVLTLELWIVSTLHPRLPNQRKASQCAASSSSA